MSDRATPHAERPAPAEEVPQEWIAAVVSAFRLKAPRVLCLVGREAEPFVASVLLAAGARPLISTAAEAPSLIGGTDGLLVGLGPFGEPDDKIEAIVEAVRGTGKAWVLDAAHADHSAGRLGLARRLLALGPAVIGASRWEFLALAGRDDHEGFAKEKATILALHDAVDLVVGGRRPFELPSRPPQSARVLAMGSGVAALIAGMAAVEADPFRAAAAGLAMIGVASDRAGTRAAGPGTFTAYLLDALAELEPWMVALEAGVT